VSGVIRPLPDVEGVIQLDLLHAVEGVRHGFATRRGRLEDVVPAPLARLHQVHTAATGSGWMRPEASSDAELHLSRRTKLRLRVPQRRAGEALALSGHVMDIDGYPLTPGTGKVVPLRPAGTLLARHVVCEDAEEESHLVARLEASLGEFGVLGATLICGRAHRISTPDATLQTRSIVVTGLDPDGAMHLLRNGIGPAGKLGCGIFVPYKRIE